MQGESHDIDHEFPEYHERLEALRSTDSDFDALVSEHDQLDSEIRNLEERSVPIADLEFEKLKFQRAALKDRIYETLRQAEAQTPAK